MEHSPSSLVLVMCCGLVSPKAMSPGRAREIAPQVSYSPSDGTPISHVPRRRLVLASGPPDQRASLRGGTVCEFAGLFFCVCMYVCVCSRC